jgi:hypothetical protein
MKSYHPLREEVEEEEKKMAAVDQLSAGCQLLAYHPYALFRLLKER